jgi:hypothetical protein
MCSKRWTVMNGLLVSWGQPFAALHPMSGAGRRRSTRSSR